jgi:CspA family cold shock protein
MHFGKVKWFNPDKGFGFLVSEAGQEIFFHYSCLVMDGFKSVQAGDPVEYDLYETERGYIARNIRRLN